ncbi:ABC transporter, permease protein 2 (cluster 4, leucine/isoleucine/valine/benzoate) (plasmid) [Cupriavidus sp. U2]|uniref:branched-chain amino acid ABC transporter permease n=1 Tax=Cupriavidus sp. U2 TaxID=2920269 RepID=UPI00129DCBDD|nr:branched-chain amino acid ABC transporter permease [Cupriavidus sp. U2]KAI3592074.1 ABC transporter, permease protein 2 (cluster 4, leucine/isoleucine/valine/benzoate) [Cupriavidus sp. U2]
MTTYLTSILVLVSIAGIAALSLNLQWGLTGMVNFGLFGFYMLAAYVYAQLAATGASPWLALAGAIAVSGIASALTSLISMRLADDYLAIVTLAFAECLRLIVIHEDWLTRGSLGIANIARPVANDGAFLLLALAALLLSFLLLETISRSPLGRAGRALRDDPLVAATLGKDVLWLRVRLFGIGGAVTGVAGALHAAYYQYIDPTQFGPIITAYAFMGVIIGGRGSNRGVLLSAFTVILLLEGTRFLNDQVGWMTPAQLAALRLMLIGIALIGALIVRPAGLLAEHRLKV